MQANRCCQGGGWDLVYLCCGLRRLDLFAVFLDARCYQFAYLFYPSFKFMKERIPSKNISKKKSQDSFFIKQKLSQSATPYLHNLQPKKVHNRASLSVLELPIQTSKEYKRRVNSLELTPADLVGTDNPKSNKNSQGLRNKNILSSCLSDRNANKDPHKLFSHSKISNSNTDLHKDQLCSSLALKQKLSVIELQKDASISNQKHEYYGIMVWVLVIRKFYAKQQKNNKENPSPSLKSLLSHLQKLQKSKIESVKFTIERTSIEPELTKEQLIQLLYNSFRPVSQLKSPLSHFKHQKRQKNRDEDAHCIITYPEVLNCLLQYQFKPTAQPIHNKLKEHPEQHEDPVETARFQEGAAHEQTKKSKRFIQIPYMMRQQSNKVHLKESFLTLSKQMPQEQSKDLSRLISPLTGKSKQSLNPSLSPFSGMESSNSRSSLQPNESDTLIFKKSGHCNASGESSLGMLTLEGKSPRQVMESEIYESMQRVGVSCHRKNNISFSLDNLEMEPHSYFEQTVHSFEEVLKKIKRIQSSYFQKSGGSQERTKQEQPSEEINLFLQQLINYRVRMELDGEGVQHYSYFVSWQDIQEVKEYNCKLMHFLLQSTYMRDFLLAIQGLKIDSSPYLYKSMKSFLHSGLKILNLSNNNIQNLDDLLQTMPESNALQCLNISYNSFTDLCQIMAKFKGIRQIHAKDNFIEAISKPSQSLYNLKIIDLSNNKIAREENMSGVSVLKGLQILNLLGNPLLQTRHWKALWKNLFSLELVFELDNLYVMSEYGHQKDIAFSRSKKPREHSTCIPKIRTFIDGKLV